MSLDKIIPDDLRPQMIRKARAQQHYYAQMAQSKRVAAAQKTRYKKLARQWKRVADSLEKDEDKKR